MKNTKKEGKSMRVKVTTTLNGELWRELQIRALTEGRDANDILEELMAGYLKRKAKSKGGER
jgi:hypothetical protein